MARFNYWIGLVLIVITIFVWYAFAETVPTTNLALKTMNPDPEVKALIKDDVKYVNLAFFTKQLKVKCDWNPETGEIRLQYGNQVFELREDQIGWLLDQTAQALTNAPFEQDRQLWFPLELVTRFGVAVKYEDVQSLELGWAEDYLLSLETAMYQGRPVLALNRTNPLQFSSFTLTQPHRLVIDLHGLKAYPALEMGNLVHAAVQKVRLSQFDADTLRIVCDLSQSSSCRVIADPENPNRLLIIFNYILQTINLTDQDGEQKIQIRTDQPAFYRVQQLANPPRAVIDFEGATLNPAVVGLAGNGNWFKRVRMSQFNSTLTRVVVDLANDGSLYKVSRDPKDPTLLVVRTIQVLKEIGWQEPSPKLGRLVFAGTDGFEATIRKMKNPSRLQVDLDFCRVRPELKLPVLSDNSCVKKLRLIPLSPTAVRVEAEFQNIIGFATETSDDSRQLFITFLKSPLMGQTIALDAGHGGEDHGATGVLGTLEKMMNLDVTMRLKELLQEAGAQVVLTRYDDEFIGLFERALLANRSGAGVFISIHSNFHPNPAVKGVEVYHYKDLETSNRLARQIKSRLVRSTNFMDLGVKTNEFVVIRETLMPSVLVELGYLSNAQEENQMSAVTFKDNAARGILRGIADYYFD